LKRGDCIFGSFRWNTTMSNNFERMH
jgi:hypothetical protein